MDYTCTSPCFGPGIGITLTAPVQRKTPLDKGTGNVRAIRTVLGERTPHPGARHEGTMEKCPKSGTTSLGYTMRGSFAERELDFALEAFSIENPPSVYSRRLIRNFHAITLLRVYPV
ncbi:hypothetical protein KM043_001430 [Ampulex compressa]|nr:hypothetical protein KM043_001430 [Ampulex compressa]